MSILRDALIKLPAACDVPEGLADVYGKLLGDLFDYEISNPGGVLHRDRFATISERLSVGMEPWRQFANPKKFAFAFQLIHRAAQACSGEAPSKADEAKLARDGANPENASVSALMTVDQASTLSSWA